GPHLLPRELRGRAGPGRGRARGGGGGPRLRLRARPGGRGEPGPVRPRRAGLPAAERARELALRGHARERRGHQGGRVPGRLVRVPARHVGGGRPPPRARVLRVGYSPRVLSPSARRGNDDATARLKTARTRRTANTGSSAPSRADPRRASSEAGTAGAPAAA